MKHITKSHIILGILLILILFVNIHYLRLKSGYFVDEGMTLYLSNGNYNGAVTSKSDSTLYDFFDEFVFRDSLPDTIDNVFNMLKELTSAGNYSEEGTVEWYDAARSLLQGQRVWMTGQELFDQLTVSKGERFQYIQVFLNQAMDVHPPFYYILVHTVFSLFPGTYSDAYLFGINIIALLMTCVILWQMAKSYSDAPYFPALAMALYGFSQGFISCVMYFRMYALFTLFSTLTLYLHFILEKHDYRSNKKISVLLISTVVLGFYTHYYYIIFLFPVFAITVVKMLIQKKKTELLSYIKRMIIAGIISLIIWPLSLYHILFGYRGTEAASNLITSGLIARIKNYYGVVCGAFFFNKGILFLIVILVGCVMLVIGLLRKNFRQFMKSQITEMAVVSVFYLLIISQIAPAQSDRYIMCLFPVMALLIASIIMNMLKRLIKSDRIHSALLGMIICFVVISSLGIITPNYLYLEQKDMKLGTGKAASQMNCLMISDDDFRGFSEALDLSRFKQIIVLGESELSILEKEKPDDLECDMVVYVLGGVGQDTNLNRACYLLDYRLDLVKYISSDIEGFNAYLLEREERQGDF